MGIGDLPAAVGEHQPERLAQVSAVLIVEPAVLRRLINQRVGKLGRNLFPER